MLLEQWLPVASLGAESLRERGASSALPPLYFLHVWWARRPLVLCRAAVLASLLPAHPLGPGGSARPWPQKFLRRWPTFEDYQAWFLQLIGIQGDPAAARKALEQARRGGRRIANPYAGPRAFTVNAPARQLVELHELFRWAWGTQQPTVCDPMAGGGSIPLEALRYGLQVEANELNPVAAVILKATLEYPARFGPSLADEVQRFAADWIRHVQHRLRPFYTPLPEGAVGACYLWARTVPCPHSGKPVPLSPNWWIRKGTDPVAVRLVADPSERWCRFELVFGAAGCRQAQPDRGTVWRGKATSPWTGAVMDGRYIKAQAQAGQMGQQLYAVAVKMPRGFLFRAASSRDLEAYGRAVEEAGRRRAQWEAAGLVPREPYPAPATDMRPLSYGMPTWADFFSPRQLLAQVVMLQELHRVAGHVRRELDGQPAAAVLCLLALALDKCADYNSRMARWHASRGVIAGTFDRHDFSFKWSHAEFDASANLLPWAVNQVLDAYRGLARLVAPVHQRTHARPKPQELPLRCTRGDARTLSHLPDRSVHLVCVDPPYFGNVQYAELSGFFHVWLKRSLGDVLPELLEGVEVVPRDQEAVVNPARFASSGRKHELARQDFQQKMQACFGEMHRVLADRGVLTVMFTHKEVEAWEALGSALMGAGFQIQAAWPVHAESEHSLHQVRKNAATSTILMVCRKRLRSGKPLYWADIKEQVRQFARRQARHFQTAGMRGVDLYTSTYGAVLAFLSARWPVLAGPSGAPATQATPLCLGEALELARQEVAD